MLKIWLGIQKSYPYLLLIIFSLTLFIPGITQVPVIDRDEAHFAEASRQMVQTGHYFQIRFQDKTRFQKPPGINWLQALSVKVFGNGDSSDIWPYRLPSVLGALLSVLLTYFFAQRFVTKEVAGFASAFLAASLLLNIEAHMAVIDTSLLSSVVLMQGSLWIIYHEGMNHKPVCFGWAFLFWFAMAYGLLLKGVTPLVGVLSVLTLCLMERRVYWLRGLHILFGGLFFVLISLSWLLQVNAAEHSNYLLQMFYKDLLPKLQGSHESHGKPPLFHLLLLPFTFWPSSLFLWQGAEYALKNRQQRTVTFLLAWILPTWIFFEIMPTKLPQYVLPTFPAIALLCALGVSKTTEFVKPIKKLRLLQSLWGVLSIGMAIAILVVSYRLLQNVTMMSVLVFLEISVMSMVCVYYAYGAAYRRAAVAVLLTALLGVPLFFSGVLPQLTPLWLSRNIVQNIDKNAISEQNPLLAVGYFEPSLVFYLNAKHVLFTDNKTATIIMRRKPTSLVLVDADNEAQMRQDNKDLIVAARAHGYNYNNGRWISTSVLRRR